MRGVIIAVSAVSFVLSAVAAVVPNVPAMIATTVVSLAVEGVLYRWQRGMVSAFAKTHADVTVRHLLCDILIVVALVRAHGQRQETDLAAPLLALLGFYALHFLIQAVSVVVRRARTLPVLTRNIDASALRLTAAPPALLLRRAGHRLLLFGLPATAGLLTALATGDALWGVAGAGVSVALALGGLAVLGSHLLPGRRPPSEEAVLKWFDSWLAEYRPTIGMYFSGGAASAYQANMWLQPLARLDGRPLIVLRERFMMQKIAATDVPVVCLPQVHHLMRLEHSTLQALIHPSNSGKTSQVLRIPTIKHAFVNHGESDKLSSCNPYAKAYDEVWVAGPEARERYALADIGVDDRDVVEIGRPQLDAVAAHRGAPEGEYTEVLYAPTWEGWDGNPGNTSVIAAGENLVRALLADPGVRLVYKPHPLTGSVDPRAGAADRRIRELIVAACRERAGGPRPGPRSAAELARRTAELDRLTTSVFRDASDAMERMMLQGAPEPGRAAAVTAATAAWVEAYWAALPEGEHQIVTEARPDVPACFNRADLLISDVSSVISDFMASGKPYAVANTSGLTEAAFREAFPTVRAATVLTPDAAGVPDLLERVRKPELDDLREARAELKLRLLGPSEPSSQVRFNDAMRALCEEALRRRTTGQEGRIPGPRAAVVPGEPELTKG
ncbi:CDP-glycerol glycerophosphotransferase family protein [Streptomyces abyssomicinicus]|uniref:CDP-glycerol glycerophosphotransferase family protein n=1 Tax=Streptomyces abyssomicinicus TaxID=574929 RepID=UPI001FE71CD3|nr:CDP-glycerol glycerophosphotransferase family protein [Streptomyces abyssomicinicus]